MKILAIDTRTDIILLEAAILQHKLSLQMQAVHKMKEALVCLKQNYYTPDVILIGSDVILREGLDRLPDLRGEETLRAIPLIILTEFSGEETYLLQENLYNTHFIAKPFDYDKIPLPLNKIVEIGRITIQKEILEICKTQSYEISGYKQKLYL